MEDGKSKIDNRKSKIVGQCAECKKDATGLYVTRYGLICLDCAIAQKEIVKQYPKMLTLARRSEIAKKNFGRESGIVNRDSGAEKRETTGSLF